jgi:hypothetical protein
LNELRARFQSERVEFYAVFSGKAVVDDFLSTYKLAFPVLLDRDFRLVDFFGATKTPEAFASLLEHKEVRSSHTEAVGCFIERNI